MPSTVAVWVTVIVARLGVVLIAFLRRTGERSCIPPLCEGGLLRSVGHRRSAPLPAVRSDSSCAVGLSQTAASPDRVSLGGRVRTRSDPSTRHVSGDPEAHVHASSPLKIPSTFHSSPTRTSRTSNAASS